MATSTTSQNRRYYLHQKIKKNDIKYSAIKRTVYWYFSKEVSNPDVLELKEKFNYQVQFELAN